MIPQYMQPRSLDPQSIKAYLGHSDNKCFARQQGLPTSLTVELERRPCLADGDVKAFHDFSYLHGFQDESTALVNTRDSMRCFTSLLLSGSPALTSLTSSLIRFKVVEREYEALAAPCKVLPKSGRAVAKSQNAATETFKFR